MDTKTVELTIGGQKRTVELRYWSKTEATPQFPKIRTSEIYHSTSPVALVRIGRSGKKLWATTITVWFYENGQIAIRPNNVNNRNNLSLQGWNDIEFEDAKRSHHNGQAWTK